MGREIARAAPPCVSWFVYLLRCGDGSLYTGIARDVRARLEQHVRGRGARYTRGRGPLTLIHVEEAATRGDAQRREAAIRRLRREAKEALAAHFSGSEVSAAVDRSGAGRVGEPPESGPQTRLRPRRFAS